MSIISGFKCNACGSTDFTFAHNPPEPTDIMTCETCKREFGTLAEITALAQKNFTDNADKIEENLKNLVKPKLNS